MTRSQVIRYDWKHWRKTNTPREILLLLRGLDSLVAHQTIMNFPLYQRLSERLWGYTR